MFNDYGYIILYSPGPLKYFTVSSTITPAAPDTFGVGEVLGTAEKLKSTKFDIILWPRGVPAATINAG